MRKYILIFYLVLFDTITLIAQIDSIKNEINDIPDSKYETILKARKLLEKSLYDGDYQKVKVVKDYLVQIVENESNTAFSIYELWLIEYWTQEFEQILKDVSTLGLSTDFDRIAKISQRSLYTNGQLLEVLENKSIESENILKLFIENSNLNIEDKTFLNLHLKYCLSIYSSDTKIQDSLNILSDQFLKSFPHSIYGPFIKKIIQYKQEASDFAIGYTFCVSYCKFQGNISRTLKNCGFIGLSFDFFYKQFYLNCYFAFSLSKLKHDISYKNYDWFKDMDASLLVPQIQLGYNLVHKNRVTISPLIGISMMDVSAVYDDIVTYPYLENVYFDSDISWNSGVCFSFFSKQPNPSNTIHRARIFQMYGQLKYTYSDLVFAQNRNDFNGGMHQFTFTVGFLSRRVKRIF